MYLDGAAAIVSADKLRDYLLSSVHPIGRYKSGPNGRSAGIVTVWIILIGETVPRFVTAYPEM